MKYRVHEGNIWNINEYEIKLRIYINFWIIAATGKKSIYIKSPQNCEWVLIIETINPSEKKTWSLVIFRKKNPQSSWFKKEEVSDWLYTILEKEWILNDIKLNWLKEIFLSKTKPEKDEY